MASAPFPASPALLRWARFTYFNPKMPDTTAVAKQLLEREHVAVTPGEAFGAPGYLRLSYATSIDRIDEGLRRLTHFFGNAA